VTAEGGDSPTDSAAVLGSVFLAAQEAGFLGPGPIERQVLHAEGFVTLAEAQPGNATARLLDLGSGGGLPGLVVAVLLPQAQVVLLEANRRRAEFLRRAVERCDIAARVRVVHQRAELCGRDPLYRGLFSGVVARSFGPPAVVAECAAPFLVPGGWLIVSEPPAEVEAEVEAAGRDREAGVEEGHRGSPRWPAERLAVLGLEPVEFVKEEFGYQILRQRQPCPEEFPRRNGVPSKKPLF
jgi:16S rRNA (guanine527-N7)-methyltransferase